MGFSNLGALRAERDELTQSRRRERGSFKDIRQDSREILVGEACSLTHEI